MYSEPMSLTPAVFILFFWPLHFKNYSFSVILFVLKFELIVQCQIQLLDQLPNFVLAAHSFSLPAKHLLAELFSQVLQAGNPAKGASNLFLTFCSQL